VFRLGLVEVFEDRETCQDLALMQGEGQVQQYIRTRAASGGIDSSVPARLDGATARVDLQIVENGAGTRRYDG